MRSVRNFVVEVGGDRILLGLDEINRKHLGNATILPRIKLVVALEGVGQGLTGLVESQDGTQLRGLGSRVRGLDVETVALFGIRARVHKASNVGNVKNADGMGV